MTYTEIKERVDYLLSLGADAYTDDQKNEIEQISLAVMRVAVKDCNCTNRWFDALVACRKWLKCHTELNKCKYELQRGMMFRYNGALITNTNLTDEAAEWFIAEFPEQANIIQKVIPNEIETKATESETKEVGTTEPIESITAVKAKKTTKKRK